jgi:hypothetical protein
MISCNGGYRFSHVPHNIFCKHRLVFADETVRQLAWNIIGGYNALNSGNLPSVRNVNRNNSRIWMR